MVKAFSIEPDLIYIEPDLIYDDGPLVLDLGMSGGALAKARRSGALRYTRKGGRVLYLGRWILDWLEKDEASAAPAMEGASR
jgi:hypothetical protein